MLHPWVSSKRDRFGIFCVKCDNPCTVHLSFPKWHAKCLDLFHPGIHTHGPHSTGQSTYALCLCFSRPGIVYKSAQKNNCKTHPKWPSLQLFLNNTHCLRHISQIVFESCPDQITDKRGLVVIWKSYKTIVSLCHRGGRMENINAWYLNTHMVYL